MVSARRMDDRPRIPYFRNFGSTKSRESTIAARQKKATVKKTSYPYFVIIFNQRAL
jgi:hypothetical protein